MCSLQHHYISKCEGKLELMLTFTGEIKVSVFNDRIEAPDFLPDVSSPIT